MNKNVTDCLHPVPFAVSSMARLFDSNSDRKLSNSNFDIVEMESIFVSSFECILFTSALLGSKW